MNRDFTIIKKLNLSNIGLISIISLIILLSFITISLFNSITEKAVESSEKTNKIIKFSQFIDNYLSNEINYNNLNNNILHHLDSNDFISQTRKNIDSIEKIRKENILLEKELTDLTLLSVTQSNKYIKATSNNLAHRIKRNNISKLERLVIISANLNTNINYKISILFLKLKENIKVKNELISFLDVALINAQKDIERLKGTPFEKLPELAKKTNLRIKEIVIQYIVNSEKEESLKEKSQKKTDNYIENIMKSNANLTKINRKTGIKTFSIFAILILIISISIVVFNYLLSKLLNNFIHKIDNDIRIISEGDLSIKIDKNLLNRKDEIGNISKSLQKMILKFNNIITQIIITNQRVSGASNQLSIASQHISSRANEQAATTEEIATSMEEILAMISSNTQNAEITSQASTKSANKMKQSNEIFIKTIKSVSEISKKITIIYEIANKTDILSINAAIEAGRAGEVGKGFSVVANEIRKLADKTKIESDEIRKLSKKGQTISKIAGKKLKNAIPKIIKSAELVNNIVLAGKEQQTGVENINISIQQLTEITNENSASAEEMSASAEELSAQAEQLKELISVFKIDNLKNENVIIEQENTITKPEKQISEYKNKGFNMSLSDKDNTDDDFETF